MTEPSPPTPARDPQPAPADARRHAPWPTWRIIAAYALLAALAAGSIWYIDIKAHALVVSLHP